MGGAWEERTDEDAQMALAWQGPVQNGPTSGSESGAGGVKVEALGQQNA